MEGDGVDDGPRVIKNVGLDFSDTTGLLPEVVEISDKYGNIVI